ELAHLDLLAGFFRLRFCQAHAADLRVAIGHAGDAELVHRPRRLARDMRDRDDAAHRATVRELRQSGDDIADGIDTLLFRLHPFVRLYEAAVGLDLRLLNANVVGARRTADGDQDFFRFDTLLLAFLVGVDH